MFFNRRKKEKFRIPTTLEYDWIGTIEYRSKLYRVYRTETDVNHPNNEEMPTIIFRLTSDNCTDGYILIGRKDPESNYWYTVSEEMLTIIFNEFLPKYNKN